jgi:hypothetical protein
VTPECVESIALRHGDFSSTDVGGAEFTRQPVGRFASERSRFVNEGDELAATAPSNVAQDIANAMTAARLVTITARRMTHLQIYAFDFEPTARSAATIPSTLRFSRSEIVCAGCWTDERLLEKHRDG